jgi:hypothetical protein
MLVYQSVRHQVFVSQVLRYEALFHVGYHRLVETSLRYQVLINADHTSQPSLAAQLSPSSHHSIVINNSSNA